MLSDKIVLQFSQQFKEVSPMQKASEMLADLGGYHVSTGASLGVVAALIGGGVGLSYALPEGDASGGRGGCGEGAGAGGGGR